MKGSPSLAFLALENPFDNKTKSGIPFYMIKALEKYWGNVEAYYWERSRVQHYVLRSLTHSSKIFLKKDFTYTKSIFFSKLVGRYFSEKLSEKEYDIVFCLGSFLVAYLKTVIPIISFSDSSFGLQVGFNPNQSHYFKKLLQSGREVEQKGYDKAALIIFTSSWAANYAKKYYSCGDKVAVLPRGPNIESTPDISVIDYRFQNRDVCNLLFLGLDWKIKGGDVVIETFMTLQKRGMKVHLTIAGCKPRLSCDGVTVIPFINKNSASGLQQFNEILSKSHFMFVPSRAECCAVAFLEASAYGLPVISTDIGGISEAVESGINGYLLPLSAGSEDFADVIQRCFFNEAKYRELCVHARKKYEEKLNWKTTITSMKQLFENRTKHTT